MRVGREKPTLFILMKLLGGTKDMRPNKSKLKRKPGKNPVSHSVKLSVEAAIRKIIEELGYECVQVLFVRESEKLILRILFDSMGGINIRDCEIVSSPSVTQYSRPGFPQATWVHRSSADWMSPGRGEARFSA